MSAPTLTIGGFSRLTGLSIRALRWYDEQGLLRPREVDEGSRYRRYATSQLERGALIARLRRLDLPLDEVRSFLDAPDQEAERTVLGRHRERLVERAAATADALRGVDRLLHELAVPDERPHRLMAMVIKTLRDQPVLRIRRHSAAAICDPSADIAAAFAAVNRQGLTQAGPPYFSASEPDDEGERSFESGIPVDRDGTADGDVEPAVLPGGRTEGQLPLRSRGDAGSREVLHRSDLARHHRSTARLIRTGISERPRRGRRRNGRRSGGRGLPR